MIDGTSQLQGVYGLNEDDMVKKIHLHSMVQIIRINRIIVGDLYVYQLTVIRVLP